MSARDHLRRRPRLHLTIVIATTLGIAALTQIVAERHNRRFDWTPSRAFTLSAVTRRLLESLPGAIDARVFVGRDDREAIAERLQTFAAAAPRFRYEMLDLDRHPGRAREEGVDRYGRAVLRHAGHRVVVDAGDEASLAAGLLHLSRGRATRILFLAGHGERNLGERAQPTGYGLLRSALEQEGYAVDSAPLPRSGEIPAEVDLLIIAGPEGDLLESEAAAIGRHLDAGGRLLALLDPVPLPNLRRLLARHGIRAEYDVVVDHANTLLGSDPFTVSVPGLAGHEITAATRAPLLVAVAGSVEREAGGSAAVLARSSSESWAVRDFARAAAEPDASVDRRGPISVAAASWRRDAAGREARVVAVGDSDFAANGMLDLLGNRAFVLNAVGWATSIAALVTSRGEADAGALRPLSPLVLTERQSRNLLVLFVVLQPAAVLAIGFGRRRR